MAVVLPSRYQIKLLCHFNNNLDDASTYQRTPITIGSIAYRNGSGYAKFDYSARALGTTSTPRLDGYIEYDISDVDLSGQFCIDYWFRNYGSYGQHFPMLLLPVGFVDSNRLEDLTDLRLYHVNSRTASTCGVYTYNPTSDTMDFTAVARNSKVNHIAVTRDENNVLRWFNDGTLVVSYTNSYDFTSSKIQVARTYSNGTGAYILVDELRVVSGHPCYTSDFTPASTAYTIPDTPHYPFMYKTATVL